MRRPLKYSERLTFCIAPDDLETLRKQAKEQKTTVGDVVRNILAKNLVAS